MQIRKVGEYFVEVWKSAGMNMDNVRFLWASEEIGRSPDFYWQLVMNIAKANSISRCVTALASPCAQPLRASALVDKFFLVLEQSHLAHVFSVL